MLAWQPEINFSKARYLSLAGGGRNSKKKKKKGKERKHYPKFI
jgi:hypothetical protein